MEKIRIDQLLIKKGYVPTRSKALQLIQEGKVYVNQQLISKAGTFCLEDDEIKIKEHHLFDYVSRGGLKLKKAIDTFHLDFNQKVVLDIGASTGGFSDCCLKHGASHVYALDVGKDQLDEKLKNDYDILMGYKQSGLNCENVSKVKEVISKISERKSSK